MELIVWVPQGSVLGPLCSIYLLMIFFYLIKKTDICNYADDNTLYVCDMKLETLMEKLEVAAEKVLGLNIME